MCGRTDLQGCGQVSESVCMRHREGDWVSRNRRAVSRQFSVEGQKREYKQTEGQDGAEIVTGPLKLQ